MFKPIALGTLLANRYYLLRHLGNREFGWQYSAVDRDRDNRLCLLEDWLPPAALMPQLPSQYRSFQARLQPFLALRHAQILSPQATILAQNRFWLVYDYPEGQTYGKLLDDRRSCQEAFTETEVVQLLQQILPLLQHLHDQNLMHCNLHLDSLFLPNTEALPYLTNLGQIRDIALDLGFESLSPDWIPPELPATIDQDLYDLGAIALQLLSATPPTTSWERYTTAVYASLSPAFARVLKRMLLPNPLARYPNAQAVLEALQRQPITYGRSEPFAASLPSLSSAVAANSEVPTSRIGDEAFASTIDRLPPTRSLARSWEQSMVRSRARSSTRSTSTPFWQDISFIVLLTLFLGLSGVAGWRIFQGFQAKPTANRVSQHPRTDSEQSDLSKTNQASQASDNASHEATPPNSETSVPSVSPTIFPESQRSRIQALQINPNWLVGAVDELSNLSAHQQIPDRQGQRWQDNLKALMKTLEKLSEQARKGLGSYRRENLEQWLQQSSSQRISESTINLITDTQFFLWFPTQIGQVLNPRQLGQIWYAIAQDQLTQLSTRLTAIPGNQSPFEHQGRLDSGESHIYQFSRSAGQFLQVQLKTSQGQPQFAIVQGNQFLARNVRESNWSGLTAKAGTYEVIISAANQPVNYAISIHGSSSPGLKE
ncbi:hypothetical protein [Alkalinema sp. FACHB-956]|uniref:protein kinase domain-containing protein n=1 Tax=Alkalinema sp. FACHB-956 TaxID=2692768 RepID=UPI001683F976|nr:hypothetical protein [Alkalinema sp. FACHB-956]MBD2328285.1 hypothetical protein [Alkalinema sp. FACHB-956]